MLLFFFQTILSFVLSRKIIKIYNDIAQKHGNVTVKDFRKYKKFKLPNVSNKNALKTRKRLRSAINKT